jgi:outer membrane protein
MRCRLVASCALGFGALVLAGHARAETLEQALADAYNGNPQIAAERATRRATDEGVPQALSGWRPTVTFTGSAGVEPTENSPGSTSTSAFSTAVPSEATLHPNVLDLNITQNLYAGGRTVALTSQAENTVSAERARAVATESTVLFSVVQAYFDVLRDQAVVQLNRNNEQVLRRQLEATNDQFRVGAATRTDVAQAEARLAGATASRLQAEGTLEVSRAEYVRAVGHPPEKLTQPTLHPVLPTTRDEATSLAATKNPNVIAALFTEDAARDAVVATRAQLLPNLSVIGDINRSEETVVPGRTTTSKSLIARITVPLYEGGNIYSQTRQAQQVVAARRSQTDDARRAALQGATQAWETIQSARASIKSLQSTIRAAQIALEGTRQEWQVGTRTVLDVLNAEQELFSDRVSLVQAQHDLAVAEFNLSQQIGRLTAADLKLPVTLYDVDKHYRAVRNQWLGLSPKD